VTSLVIRKPTKKEDEIRAGQKMRRRRRRPVWPMATGDIPGHTKTYKKEDEIRAAQKMRKEHSRNEI
jgi:hypothetical protein